MKIANLDRLPFLKMLIYGDSGSGKTTFIGSAMQCEETFPLLVLNASGQPISLRYLKQRPLVLEVEKIKDFNAIYSWLYKGQDMHHLERMDKSLCKVVYSYLEGKTNPMKFRSIAVDSITQVQRLAMETVTMTPDAKGKITGHTLPENPGDIPAATQIQHWGRTLALMTNFADRFFRLDMHVFMTALTRRDEVPSMGLTLFCPFLWGQSNLEVPSHAQIVGRLMNTGSIPFQEERAVKATADKTGEKVPFNIMYLRGGRDFIAKWQGVIDPPSRMADPTVARFLKRYATGA